MPVECSWLLHNNRYIFIMNTVMLPQKKSCTLLGIGNEHHSGLQGSVMLVEYISGWFTNMLNLKQE